MLETVRPKYGSFRDHATSGGAVTEVAAREFIVGNVGEDVTFRKTLTVDPRRTIGTEIGVPPPDGGWFHVQASWRAVGAGETEREAGKEAG